MPSIKKLMMAWNHEGDFKVGPHPDKTGWSDKYMYISGGCYTKVQLMKDPSPWLFYELMSLIVRENVSPEIVHREMLQVNEYVDHIATDILPVRHPKYDAFGV